MATIAELKEHLEHGGKIRRPSWENGVYMITDDNGRQLLCNDWEVYEEPKKKKFEITRTGIYKTRDGRKALVSYIDPNESIYVIWGVIEGEMRSRIWSKKGEILEGGVYPEDIVAEWED